MTVGIYMPAYNVEKYIKQSIESIIKQSYADWQLVILDDCSADKTYEAACSIEDKRINVFKNENHDGLIGKLKNKAISYLPDCKYLCHVGSDDWITKDCLMIYVDYMEEHPDVGACCGSFVCFNEKQIWGLPHVTNSGEYNSAILLRYMCLFPHRFYRKEIVDKVGGYSNELSSAVDYDLALKIDEITKIHRIKEPITYYYRQHSQQVSTKARGEQDLNAKKALEDALKRRKIDMVVENSAPPFVIRRK